MHMNPFALGCWPGNSNADDQPETNIHIPGTTPQPSIFGALPFASPPSNSGTTTAKFISFRFTSFNPTILNSTFLGPNLRPYFRVRTDIPRVGFTVIRDEANQPAIIIEWAPTDGPIVEIRDVVSKTRTAEWLMLSTDKSYRTMRALEKTFVWAKDGETLCLYAPGLGTPQLHARVTRTEDAVHLDLTTEAVQIGLLPVCVAATLLLQCGRRID